MLQRKREWLRVGAHRSMAASTAALHARNLDRDKREGVSSRPLHRIEHGRGATGVSLAVAASVECSGARVSRVTQWGKKMGEGAKRVSAASFTRTRERERVGRLRRTMGHYAERCDGCPAATRTRHLTRTQVGH
jgi:hypothetical protein